MIRRLFLDHPREVGESYREHLGVASSFGFAMIWGGLKALVHAVVPAWCVTSGSDTIRRLHTIMVQKRGAQRDATIEAMSVEWVI
jgi:Family of unknown function (DUF6356)